MKGLKAKFRVTVVVILSSWIALAALYGLLKPITNGCVMTYMYPTYIPISTPKNVSATKYGLYLYHEGWKRIDFQEHLKKLGGVPVLFIPGNGGCYKQVRSLAKESDRAYQGGPLERTFYQEAALIPEEGGMNMPLTGFKLPNQYNFMLDWFAVDLEGEHSAMDGQILEDHTEYVVYAIHRILDQYKESRDAREKEGAATSGKLPKSVILVGHSMGGFVARAATVHPHLRKSTVETIITLSTPHQSPPVALQPSLGRYYKYVNEEWRKGYEIQTSRTGNYVSDPTLSRVVVVSISGGINDYQVRTKLESLEGIVPPTNGFLISSSGMKNVWLSMEHQVILWCNQLVVQMSHTLLSLIDPQSGRPFPGIQKRLTIFTTLLRSAIPQSVNWMRPLGLAKLPASILNDTKDIATTQVHALSACASNIDWSDDALERDLYIQTCSVTVLAMDGRRRWLDIQDLGSNGKSHFMLVTNLAPCSGIRLHLWPEKGNSSLNFPSSKRVLEVTSKMVHIPSGQAPRQIEPGSQTEQPPPSGLILLGPEHMRGFRFLTISVAPRPMVSGRPPPAASMAVGQFFNPKEGEREFSPLSLLFSAYSPVGMPLKEDHPLAFNMSFSISLGLLPVSLSLKTVGCGIRTSGLPVEEAGDLESSRLCKLRCFPPVALVWDSTSGLHVFPNSFSETIVVDSMPGRWSSFQGSEKTILLLLVDPHCSYQTSISVSVTAAASRFVLLYWSEVVGLSLAVILFALMRQAHAWDHDLPLPSVLRAIEINLRVPFPFLLVAALPILIPMLFSFLLSQPFPPVASFVTISLICYLCANAAIIVLLLITQMIFYIAAITHVFVKIRWQAWEASFSCLLFQWLIRLSSRFLSFKVVRILKGNLLMVTTLVAVTSVCFVHPALGLFILVLSHVFSCHGALCSFFSASFRSNAQRSESFDSIGESKDGPQNLVSEHNGGSNRNLPNEGNNGSLTAAKSFGDTQLEIFHHRHGVLLLHLLATFLFGPSVVAWFRRTGLGHGFPRFLDSVLCVGVILHGVCNSKLEMAYFPLTLPGISSWEIKPDVIYLCAGYYSFISALALAPYRAFDAMAALGVIALASRLSCMRNRDRRVAYFRKHSHRH